MDRRELSKVLLGSVAGSALLSARAAAQDSAAQSHPRTAAEIAAGVMQPEMHDFRINSLRRHTIKPNTLRAINVQGVTAKAWQSVAWTWLCH